jgi:hydrogenase maturation protease
MRTPAAPAVLVVGVGIASRGDDAAGLAVARLVRERLAARRPDAQPDVAVCECTGDASPLLDVLNRAGAVVLADAVHSGAPAGTLHRLDVCAGPLPAGFRRASTHALGVAEAVELARRLGILPPSFVIIGIEAASFGIGEGLSGPVAAVVPTAAERVLNEIDNEIARARGAQRPAPAPPAESQGRPLLIAFGNPLLGDDGVGPEVAKALAGRTGLDVQVVHQMVPELAMDVARSSLVVFVDASRVYAEVRVLPLSPGAEAPTGSHGLGPGGVLALAQGLYGRCPPSYLVAVPGQSFELGGGLSELAQRHIPAAVRAVERLLESSGSSGPAG